MAFSIPGTRASRRGARLTSISSFGVTLEAAAPVEPGAVLRIEFGNFVATGRAVYCRPAAGSCYIGVELDHAIRILDSFRPAPEVTAAAR